MAETSREKVLIVIPARWESSRFPGKPLARLGEKTMIRHVCDRASRVRGVDRVVVATDDGRVAEHVESFGGEAVMTSGEHPTGTDRVAEVASSVDHEIIVNLQGDEPALDPAVVEELVAFLESGTETPIVTLARRDRDASSRLSPDVVKVDVDARGRARRFFRGPSPDEEFLHHVGIYAFRREALVRFASLPRTRLELAEGLEQMRALEHGIGIGVLETRFVSHGVDRPADLPAVARILSESR